MPPPGRKVVQVLKKLMREGGLDTIFFPDIFLRHIHYGVGVPSAYQADFWGEKQKQNKK